MKRGSTISIRGWGYVFIMLITILAALPAYAEDDAAVWIVAPSEGDVIVSDHVSVSVSFYGIDRVRLYVNGDEKADALVSGNTSWDFPPVLVPAGDVELKVVGQKCGILSCTTLDEDTVNIKVKYVSVSTQPTAVVGKPVLISADVCRADKAALYVNGEKIADKSADDDGCTTVDFSFTPQETGKYTIRVDAVDCSFWGLICSWDTPVDSDSTTVTVKDPYTVTILEPRDGSVVEESPFEIGVRYSGFDGCPDPTVAIYVDDAYETAKSINAGAGSVTFEISVPEGGHTIKAVGYCDHPDKDGGYAEDSITVNADYPESVEITYPEDGESFDDSHVVVRYSYSGLGYCTGAMAYLYLNGVSVVGRSISDYSGTGSFDAYLSEGENEISIRITCSKGTTPVSIEDTVRVTYEPSGPSPPPSGDTDPPEITDVYLLVNGERVDSSGDAFTIEYSDLPVEFRVCVAGTDNEDLYYAEVNVHRSGMPNYTRKVFYFDGKQDEACSSEIYLYNDGVWVLDIGLYDESGNSNSETYTLDVVPESPEDERPKITEWDYPNRVYVDQSFNIHVCGEDQDEGGERIERVHVWISDFVTGERVFDRTENATNNCADITASVGKPGDYTVHAEVIDDEGTSSGPNTFGVVLEVVEPTFTVRLDYADSGCDGSDEYIEAKATAEYYGHDIDSITIKYRLSGSSAENTLKHCEFDGGSPRSCEGKVYVSPGTYDVWAEAKSGSKTASSDVETVYVSSCYVPPLNKPPEITRFDVPAVVAGRKDFNVYICASDSDGTVTKVGAKVGDGSWTYAILGLKSGCKTITLTAPSTPGTYTVYGIAVDDDGATDTEENILTVAENKSPVVTAVDASPNPVVAGASVYVRVCGSDSDGTIVSVSAWIENGEKGTAPAENDCGMVELTAPSTPGTYLVYGTVTDDDGAEAEEPKYTLLTVLPVSHAPTVDKIGVEGTPYENVDFFVYAYVSDQDGDLARADLNILDASGESVGYWSVPVFGESDIASFGPIRLSAGEYNAVVTVFDRVGNKGTKSSAFTVVSNEPPVVKSVSVLGDIYVGSPFDVNVCAYDPDDDVEWITLTVSPYGSSTAQRVGTDGCHVITVPTPGDDVTPGDYNLIVEAIDYRDAKSDPYIVPIAVLPPKVEDNVPPTIEVTAPESVAVGTDIVLHIIVTDNNTVGTVDIRTPTGTETYTPETNLFTLDYNYPVYEEGIYEFNIVAEDPAGNISWKVVTVTATTEGHTYDLILTASSGLVGRVVAEGKVDGKYTNITCDDVVVSVKEVESGSILGSIEKQTISVDDHSACQISITGAGTYRVTVSWMGDTESVLVKVFAKVAAAPENPVVAAVMGVVALAILAWLAH